VAITQDESGMRRSDAVELLICVVVDARSHDGTDGVNCLICKSQGLRSEETNEERVVLRFFESGNDW
jgi:hypothetical protein